MPEAIDANRIPGEYMYAYGFRRINVTIRYNFIQTHNGKKRSGYTRLLSYRRKQLGYSRQLTELIAGSSPYNSVSGSS